MPLDQSIAAGPSASEKLGEEVRMSFGDHIDALRRRLIAALIGIVLASAITLYFGMDIIAWLAAPFIQALAAKGFPAQTYVRDPTLGFGLYLRVSVIAAVILASPWVIYQIWAFIAEGLYENEKRAMHLLAPFSTLMTLLAVLFGRYVLLPTSLVFFISFATLYPQVHSGEPGFMLRLLMRTQGVQTPARPAEKPTAKQGSAKARGANLKKSGSPQRGEASNVPQATRAHPLTSKMPVLPMDPPQPAEGAVWINAAQGQMKAFFNGQVHVMSVTSSRLLAPLPDIGEYVQFAAMLGLGLVIAFQVPVVMLVVGWSGLVDPAWLAPFRKYAIFACAAAGALLTPSDVFSMMVLAFPLYGLFELGLLLMKRGYRGRIQE